MPADRLDERRRLEAIERLGVLHRIGDPSLTAFTRVAAHVAGSSSAAVHVLDDRRQHRIAAVDAPLGTHPREDAMCRLVVDGEERIVCADATLDARFAGSSFVRSETPVRFYASFPLRVPDGSVIGTLCAWDVEARAITPEQRARLEDLAEQVVAQIELRQIAVELGHVASHDPLTGAVNRLLLSDRLAQAFARQARADGDVIVALVDVDDFKAINDRRGHDAGDQVLIGVVHRLLACTRMQDTVARLGGDEFVVVVETERGRLTPPELLRRLECAFLAPMTVAGEPLVVRVTVGAALAEPGDDVRSALARADERMYERKPRGSRRCIPAAVHRLAP